MVAKLLSVIVPAYKQEKTITKDLERIKAVLDQLRYPNELICVVDGKVDNTYEVASRYAKNKKNIRVIGYEHNRGKGNAVRFGMAASKGDIIAFIDAGMDINPNGLSMILEHFEWYGADIVVGSKRHPVSIVHYDWKRWTMSFCYHLLVRVLFGLSIKDTQVGLKCYRREVLEKVLPRLIVKNFAFDIEILAVASYLGFNRIYEAPVQLQLHANQASSVFNKGFIRTVFATLIDTLAIFYRLRLLNYYSDENKRKWVYDPDLNFRVNV